LALGADGVEGVGRVAIVDKEILPWRLILQMEKMYKLYSIEIEFGKIQWCYILLKVLRYFAKTIFKLLLNKSCMT